MTDTDADAGATGRLLVGLAAVATLVTLLGIVVVWSLTYGPLG
ncbi:MAG: hypothetical protein ABEJ61_10050 [Haloferacaceae archaeon]